MDELEALRRRFWSKVSVVDDEDSCWEWKARIHVRGYGQFMLCTGIIEHAHRSAYRLSRGDIPTGMQVLHRCDNRRCVRPSHLFLGTNADNVADKVAKGRCASMPGSDNPCAKLTEESVREIRFLCSSGVRQRDVAFEYGVSQPMISMIVRREKWTHI